MFYDDDDYMDQNDTYQNEMDRRDREWEELIALDMAVDLGLGFYDHTGDEEDCDLCGYEADHDIWDED